VIAGRVQTIAQQDRPPLLYHDQDRAVEEGHGDEQHAEESLRRLEDAVTAFCTFATRLAPEQWDRVGIHARAGEISLREIAHDLPHELEHHAMDMRRVGAALADGSATYP
jgi:hypothetical protein